MEGVGHVDGREGACAHVFMLAHARMLDAPFPKRLDVFVRGRGRCDPGRFECECCTVFFSLPCLVITVSHALAHRAAWAAGTVRE